MGPKHFWSIFSQTVTLVVSVLENIVETKRKTSRLGPLDELTIQGVEIYSEGDVFWVDAMWILLLVGDF